eukprot:gene28074-31202_t
MLLSKELLSDFSMEESNVKEEWKQSYEGIEDASAWKGLNRKRKLEKLFEQYALAYKSIWESFAPIHEERTKARIAAKTAESAFLIAKSELEECERALAPAEAVCSNLLSLAWETSSSLLACFSMPFKQKFPQRRRFQVLDYSLVFVRDALERVRRKNRGAFALLEQRVVGLRPDVAKTLDKRLRSVIRCKIQVLCDPLTGFFIVHVGQNESPVEESTQHEDFHLEKKDFSNLTSHALENDIVLAPEDVKKVLTLKQRPRSLDGVKKWKEIEEKFRGNGRTFQIRRDTEEKEQIAVANQLINMLKLQPHTG